MLYKAHLGRAGFIVLLSLTLVGQPVLAHARSGGDNHKSRDSHDDRASHGGRDHHRGQDWGWHGGRGWYPQHRSYSHYHSYPYGRVVVDLPGGFIRVVLGGGRYYYGDGLFYRENANRYMVVPAPVGAVVYTVPSGYHQVVIDGSDYYTYNGVYYRRVPEGFVVVDPPTPVVVDTATVSSAPAVQSNVLLAETPDIFTVNILNPQGSYTQVVLKKLGTGYEGPQGEYYREFPKVEQLRAMYAQ